MADFTNHNSIMKLLEAAQEADSDNREKVREVHHFLDKPDGQWEPDITQRMRGRPRYTFDQCNPIVDDIAGEMQQADFDIRVKPAGGEATKDLAKTFDGMIRNIETISNASQVYNEAGRSMVAAGMDGWEVVQRWGDNDSFDQDLFIDHIPNFVDSVWFDPSSTKRDRSDAGYCFKLHTMSMDDYKEDFPEGSGRSVGDDRSSEVYSFKADLIVVGSFYYKVKVKREIIEMTNGAVFVADDDFEKVQDELAAQGIKEKRRRTRDIDEVKIRLFDGDDWLEPEQDTVFDFLPIIPTYGNYKVSENKVIYWGEITKKMDAQRVYNYAVSRQIEETALAPRSKLMITRAQAISDTATLQTMNTNNDPVQTYTHEDGQPPPFQIAGAQSNPGLLTTTQSALQNLQRSNLGQPGQPVGLRSGVAVELEQNKADTQNIKYFAGQEVAICHTARILISAIPRVYDTARQVRVLGEDGAVDMVTLNERIFDQQTQQMVEINDLSKGVYDVTCSVGPAFKNRQSETVAAFLEVAAIDPSIMQTGKDIFLGNMTAPGFDLLAERVREQIFQAGGIPLEQMTDEEKQKAQQAAEAAANQPPAPDPLMIAAQAEDKNADSLAREREAKSNISLMKEQTAQFNAQTAQTKAEREASKQDFDQQMEEIELVMKRNEQQNDNVTKSVDSLVKLIKGFGIEAIAGRAPETLITQAGAQLDEAQDSVDNRQ